MTIIEIWPNKFSNQNFVRQGLPAKRQMVPFRFTSLMMYTTFQITGPGFGRTLVLAGTLIT